MPQDPTAIYGTKWLALAAALNMDGTVPSSSMPEIASLLPTGLIAMWSGLLAAIPNGWALCNGQNGTPDLRDRFIKGAANAANPGTTGGAATHGHTTTQPADHPALTHSGATVGNHAVTQPGAHTNHVVTQPSAHTNHAALGTHAHELPFTKLAGATGALRMLAQSVFGSGTSRAPESVSAAPTANTTAATVALSQAVSGGTPDAHSAHAGGAVDAHSAHAGTAVDAHTVGQSTQHAIQAHSGAAVNTVNSEPAYFALAFIMKT